MDDPPLDNRQVLVWTFYAEWVIGYYEHGWRFSANHDDDIKLELNETFGWRECPPHPPEVLNEFSNPESN
jgi:hypothetical protein